MFFPSKWIASLAVMMDGHLLYLQFSIRIAKTQQFRFPGHLVRCISTTLNKSDKITVFDDLAVILSMICHINKKK